MGKFKKPVQLSSFFFSQCIDPEKESASSMAFFADEEDKKKAEEKGFKKDDIVDIALFRGGSFSHYWYGSLDFDDEYLNKIIRNFNRQAYPVDVAGNLDHEASKAMGWIVPGEGNMYIRQVELDRPIGKVYRNFIYAKVQLTESGAKALNDKEYRYISAEIQGNYSTREKYTTTEVKALTGPGTDITAIECDDLEANDPNKQWRIHYGPTMTGFAFTNKPFMPGMPSMFSQGEKRTSDESDVVFAKEKDEDLDLGRFYSFVNYEETRVPSEGEFISVGEDYYEVRDLKNFNQESNAKEYEVEVLLRDLKKGGQISLSLKDLSISNFYKKLPPKDFSYTCKGEESGNCGGCRNFDLDTGCRILDNAFSLTGHCDLWDPKNNIHASQGDDMNFSELIALLGKTKGIQNKLEILKSRSQQFSNTGDAEAVASLIADYEVALEKENESKEFSNRLSLEKAKSERLAQEKIALSERLADVSLDSARNRVAAARTKLEKFGCTNPMLEKFDSYFSNVGPEDLDQKFSRRDENGEATDSADVLDIIVEIFSEAPKHSFTAPTGEETEVLLNNDESDVEEPEVGGGSDSGNDATPEEIELSRRAKLYEQKFGHKPASFLMTRLAADGSIAPAAE